MAADADPSFEVATIKPSAPDEQGKGFLVRGDRFITVNTTLVDLIKFSYDLQDKQILDGPAWVATDKFDIAAQPDIPGIAGQQAVEVDGAEAPGGPLPAEVPPRHQGAFRLCADGWKSRPEDEEERFGTGQPSGIVLSRSGCPDGDECDDAGLLRPDAGGGAGPAGGRPHGPGRQVELSA